MSKELDDKLREIYQRCDVSNNRTENPLHEDEAIAEIKQAFADAGYHIGTVTKYTLPELLASDNSIHTKPEVTMTGQEWYERFVLELKKESKLFTENPRKSGYMIIELAAKRASGLADD